MTCDADSIHMFTVYGLDSGRPRKPKNQPEPPREMRKTLENGMMLSGTYKYRYGMMHTHFRFSPTSDGVLMLLKVFDHSVDCMVMKQCGMR